MRRGQRGTERTGHSRAVDDLGRSVSSVPAPDRSEARFRPRASLEGRSAVTSTAGPRPPATPAHRSGGSLAAGLPRRRLPRCPRERPERVDSGQLRGCGPDGAAAGQSGGRAPHPARAEPRGRRPRPSLPLPQTTPEPPLRRVVRPSRGSGARLSAAGGEPALPEGHPDANDARPQAGPAFLDAAPAPTGPRRKALLPARPPTARNVPSQRPGDGRTPRSPPGGSRPGVQSRRPPPAETGSSRTGCETAPKGSSHCDRPRPARRCWDAADLSSSPPRVPAPPPAPRVPRPRVPPAAPEPASAPAA